MTEQMYTPRRCSFRPGPHYSDPEYPIDVVLNMEPPHPTFKGGVSAVVHDIVCGNRIRPTALFTSFDKNLPHEDLYGMPENVK